MINLSSFAVAVISSFLDFPFFLDDGIVMALGLSGIASRLFFGDAESDTGSDMCRAQGEMIIIDYRRSLKTRAVW